MDTSRRSRFNRSAGKRRLGPVTKATVGRAKRDDWVNRHFRTHSNAAKIELGLQYLDWGSKLLSAASASLIQQAKSVARIVHQFPRAKPPAN